MVTLDSYAIPEDQHKIGFLKPDSEGNALRLPRR